MIERLAIIVITLCGFGAIVFTAVWLLDKAVRWSLGL